MALPSPREGRRCASELNLKTMNRVDRRKFYEKLYFHELEVRDKVENRLKLPFSIFAIVFTLAVFLFNEVLVKKSVTVDAFFWTVYLGALLALVFAVGFFIVSWYGYTYKMLPTASDVEAYYGQILTDYQKVSPHKARAWAKEAFDDYLMETFKTYATHNTRNNDRKAFYLHRCVTALIISFMLICVAFYPYYNSLTEI